ncbi:ADP-ribosyl cyclase/cyclic ADP-ribose hydrolase [Citrus sinensis]|nr:ADP-ribosyl cyclase/cyclic ADP-ribose hydrolase [Citrus sinensis]
MVDIGLNIIIISVNEEGSNFMPIEATSEDATHAKQHHQSRAKPRGKPRMADLMMTLLHHSPLFYFSLQSLVNAIEASDISVIVFSEGYASSRWCLDELVKILECKKEYAQIVIPVFYRVDPSDARNQIGHFGISFSKLEERFKENTEKLRTWRKALKEAVSLSGFHSLNIRRESELINEVVNHILKRLDEVFRPRDNKNQLVGVESTVEEIESLLGVESKGVYALGIWGIGGIGKTTIARAIFDKISGEHVDPVMKFFNASGFYPEIGMSVLVDKSLIAIDSYIKITMHDLLQELGREIVRQESIDPGNRSRLWHHEDIYEVLTYNTGTEKIEGICLDMSKVKEIRLNPNTYTKIPKLRFLKFYSSSINGENKCKISYLQDSGFAEVKYLHWYGYPLKSLPSNLSAEKLVLLEVPHSDIEQLWDCVKHYSNLNQIIHAACNKLIAKTPNPTLMSRLNKLVFLNLRGSKNLKSLPSGIFSFEFLTKLDLSGCSKLKRLPEISSGNISWFFLRGTAIEELPSSIERLPRLGLPEYLGQFSLPIVLNLVKTNIERIPKSINQLVMLRYVLLSYSERLQSSPKPLFIERGRLALQPFLGDSTTGIVQDTLSHMLDVLLQEIWVDPPDMRNQNGNFGDSFLKLEERLKENTEKLQSWRNALKEFMPSLSGFHSLNIT